MIWIYIFWPVSILLALLVGVMYRRLLDLEWRVDMLEEEPISIETTEDQLAPAVQEEPKSVIIDPTDINQQVRMEQIEAYRKLNPELTDNEVRELLS